MWADASLIHGLASCRCGRPSGREDLESSGLTRNADQRRRSTHMSANTKRVPEALHDDVPDVVEALDIARMLFEKGDKVEAARFVRRASDAAHKASRLIALARAADELEASS